MKSSRYVGTGRGAWTWSEMQEDQCSIRRLLRKTINFVNSHSKDTLFSSARTHHRTQETVRHLTNVIRPHASKGN